MPWDEERDPIKVKARSAVNNSVRAGLLPPISTQLCRDCGMTAEDYDHQYGYDKVNWLTVVPRCRECHNVKIRERGEREYPPYRGNPAKRRQANAARKQRKYAYHKQWALRNRERLRKYLKDYYAKHRQKLIQRAVERNRVKRNENKEAKDK